MNMGGSAPPIFKSCNTTGTHVHRLSGHLTLIEKRKPNLKGGLGYEGVCETVVFAGSRGARRGPEEVEMSEKKKQSVPGGALSLSADNNIFQPQGPWALSARSVQLGVGNQISEENFHCPTIGCDSCCPSRDEVVRVCV